MDYKDKISQQIKTTFSPKDEDCADKKPAASNTKKKILFIDDNQTLCEMYAMKFTQNGYEAKTANSGGEALNIIRSGFVPDVLLTDLMIPVMDGFSIFEVIKKENLAPNVIAIMLTNKGLSEEINKAKELGFQGFIVKAMTIPAEVVDSVNKICKEHCM